MAFPDESEVAVDGEVASSVPPLVGMVRVMSAPETGPVDAFVTSASISVTEEPSSVIVDERGSLTESETFATSDEDPEPLP